jgi:hypothetical protein
MDVTKSHAICVYSNAVHISWTLFLLIDTGQPRRLSCSFIACSSIIAYRCQIAQGKDYFCKIRGYHDGVYEKYKLLECDAV